MTKVDTFSYRVDPGETITLEIGLKGLGDKMVRVSKPMTKVQGADLTWETTVPAEKPPKVLFVIVEVSFVEPPPGAKANLAFSGSNGGTFAIPAITANSPIKDPDFSFRVVKP